MQSREYEILLEEANVGKEKPEQKIEVPVVNKNTMIDFQYRYAPNRYRTRSVPLKYLKVVLTKGRSWLGHGFGSIIADSHREYHVQHETALKLKAMLEQIKVDRVSI